MSGLLRHILIRFLEFKGKKSPGKSPTGKGKKYWLQIFPQQQSVLKDRFKIVKELNRIGRPRKELFKGKDNT